MAGPPAGPPASFGLSHRHQPLCQTASTTIPPSDRQQPTPRFPAKLTIGIFRLALSHLLVAAICALWFSSQQHAILSLACESKGGSSYDSHENLTSALNKPWNHTLRDSFASVHTANVNYPTTIRANTRVAQCTQEQMENIARQLMIEQNSTTKIGRLRSYFSCPEPEWISSFYQEESDIGSESFLGISIGCNKGYDAISTARMGMSSPEFDLPNWRNTIHIPSKQAEGACNQRNATQSEIVFSERRGEMHCVEPMPSTYAELKETATKLELESQGFFVSQVVISSTNGVMRFPNADAGVESMGIGYCDSGEDCVDVPMFSLDSYIENYVKMKGPINVLQIDVEGFDFDVLFGASSALERTHYLEFEYHKVGNWAGLHLLDAIKLLDGKGFTCYWAGRKRLWRITGCYFDIYNVWHGWSNVACVKRAHEKLAGRMENHFLSTLTKW